MRSASDFQLVLVVFYAIALTLLPTSSLTLHFVHAITWCLFQSFGLGVLLRAQSQSKFLVRHYLKHYHYPQHDRGQGAVQEAFQNWKVIYNLSMCMTYGEYGMLQTSPRLMWLIPVVSSACLAWRAYSISHWQQWTVGNELLRHTLGVVSARDVARIGYIRSPIPLVDDWVEHLVQLGVVRSPRRLWLVLRRLLHRRVPCAP